ncbi:hypothetical protein MSG28_005070 [Choristoneura fumiferana]|uniref:Uncharacterized protein n=1 Tax=Choristoneura fumiferana TaxID=7141 RepID=A0ACC0JQD9_CHOFU|nr:hypothetical protein MSG28_005070 [Choristoneura fumiferana]
MDLLLSMLIAFVNNSHSNRQQQAEGRGVRSVRRTSLREKQMAAKADARGEARLRETFDSVVDDDMQVRE